MERFYLKLICLFVCVVFFSSCQNENDPIVETGEPDPMYNCIAWNLCISCRWINPSRYITDFKC